MRLKFGINFEIRLHRDEPESLPYREGDATTHLERSPAEDYAYEDRDRVAPASKPVLGFRADTGGA